jgi:osmotically-inducible protein OsmY
VKKFQELRGFRKVTFILSDAFRDLASNLEGLIQKELARAGVRDSQILFVRSSVATTVASISREAEAVLITLLPQLDTDDHATLLGAFKQMRLPVFSVGGRTLVQMGALAGWGTDDAVDQIAARVASNIRRIVGGENASVIPVELNVQPQLAINLETAGAFGISPRTGWQDAMLVMETLGAGASAPSMTGMTPVRQPTPQRPAAVSEVPRSQVEILADIRRRIFQLRDFSAFDAINPKVVGNGQVLLLGYVFKPNLKREAERVVRTIKGVQSVDNQIEILPDSQRDNEIRVGVYKSIYGHPSLKSYNPGGGSAGVDSGSLPRGPHPILILVKNRNVALIGQVSSDSHRRTAEIQARTISGVGLVENYLKVG